jgi:hypothetical protein
MRDPHVVALLYHLKTGPQLVFNQPAPLERDADAFTLRLADSLLWVEMKDHFPTEGAAQLAVEPYLRSWEIATALQDGPGAMSFVFERAEVSDRDPPPLGGGDGECVGDGGAIPGGAAPAQYSPARYPEPPAKFIASPEVIIMWSRYQGYTEGREPLPAMAQFCLTTIEQRVGGKQARKGAAARYAIDVEGLRRLGRLTSAVGDAQLARQQVPGRALHPHPPAEVAWMEAVVRRLIQRAGEWAADRTASWPQITMKNFPGL